MDNRSWPIQTLPQCVSLLPSGARFLILVNIFRHRWTSISPMAVTIPHTFGTALFQPSSSVIPERVGTAAIS
jgi:hypothetical protein